MCVCVCIGCQLMHEQDHFLFVYSKELYQRIKLPERIFIVDIVCMEQAPHFGNQSQRDSVYRQIGQDSKTRIPQLVFLCAWIPTQVFLCPHIMC